MPAMENVLTLVAGPAAAPLDDSMIAVACAALQHSGARTGPDDWLAAGLACDIPFDGMPPREATVAARNALEGMAVDLVAQSAAGRRKRLLVADMESTIIGNEMLDELAGELGLHDRVAAITARAMGGELDFAESLRERVAMLAGLDEEVIGRMRERISINPGAVELVATMRANGAYCALVSGGFAVYTEYVGDLLGFDYHQANRLEVREGRLTGRVARPILDRHAKQECLIRLVRERGIPSHESIAVGDGANDLSMVLAAGLGVAYHAKPILADAAAMRVDHGDLTALLYAQGYRREEFSRGSARTA